MKKLLQSDKNKRHQFKIFEHKKVMLKNIVDNRNFSRVIRWQVLERLFLLPKSSQTQISNRCVITGRKKRINRLYSFSRILLLKLIRLTSLNGFKKSSW